jgi:hypothetical protein
MDGEKFEKMAEMMKSCCPGEDGMADCCSMVKKMMEKTTKQRGDVSSHRCEEMMRKMVKDCYNFQKEPEESRE